MIDLIKEKGEFGFFLACVYSSISPCVYGRFLRNRKPRRFMMIIIRKSNKKRGKVVLCFAVVYGRFLSINKASTIATTIITMIIAIAAVYKVVVETPEVVVTCVVVVAAAAAVTSHSCFCSRGPVGVASSEGCGDRVCACNRRNQL